MMLKHIKDGVREIVTNTKYSIFLDMYSRIMNQDLSTQNIIAIFLQNKNVDCLKGFDQWKDYGRQVKQGARSIEILSPAFFHEKYVGELYKNILENLYEQIATEPNKIATYQIGKSSMELTMMRGIDGIEVKVKDKEVLLLDTFKKQREFIDNNILGKIIEDYKIIRVFDIKDTIIPEYLWVKENKCHQSEWALDQYGLPQKDQYGNIKIINTLERQQKAGQFTEQTNVGKDLKSIKRLVSALQSVSGKSQYMDEGQDLVSWKQYAANLILQMAHSDRYDSFDAFTKDMKQTSKISDMGEWHAESIAFLVGKQFGITIETNSFNNISNWAKNFEIEDLEKAIESISINTNNMLSEIKIELERQEFIHEMQEGHLETYTNKDTKKLAGQYVMHSLTEQRNITEQIEYVSKLKIESRNQPEVQYLITQQERNLRLRQYEITNQIDLSTKLECVTNYIEQKELRVTIDCSAKRCENLKKAFQGTSERITQIMQANRITLKEQFAATPEKIIKILGKKYPLLADLSKIQLSYIVKSQYINEFVSKYLNSNPQKFVETVVNRSNNIPNIISKNSFFVEISKCEKFTNEIVFSNGDLCHPKVAESTVKNAEMQIRRLKQEAERKGEYFPYNKCFLTIFNVSEDIKKLSAYHCRVDIGDGTQKGLSDYLHQEVGAKEIVRYFDVAIHEKNAKDKIIRNPIEQIDEVLEQPIERNQEDMASWKESIEKEREKKGENQSARQVHKMKEKHTELNKRGE